MLVVLVERKAPGLLVIRPYVEVGVMCFFRRGTQPFLDCQSGWQRLRNGCGVARSTDRLEKMLAFRQRLSRRGSIKNPD